MRFFVCFVLMAIVALAAAIPIDREVPDSLYDVDVQGHENIGEREARQFGGHHGGFGGHGGGFGGHGGGFGGHGGGFGGHGGGFGGHRGGFGGGHGGGFGGHHGGHYHG